MYGEICEGHTLARCVIILYRKVDNKFISSYLNPVYFFDVLHVKVEKAAGNE